MAQGTPTPGGPQRGSLQRVLLVDDNDRYATALTADLIARGVTEIVRAVNAREGIQRLRDEPGAFDGVVSDISMEHQISGLRVLRAARRISDPDILVACATTGLDSPIAYRINRFILGSLFRCDYLIPKRPIKRDERVIWIRAAQIWQG